MYYAVLALHLALDIVSIVLLTALKTILEIPAPFSVFATVLFCLAVFVMALHGLNQILAMYLYRQQGLIVPHSWTKVLP